MKSRFSVASGVWSPQGFLTVKDPEKGGAGRIVFDKLPGGKVKSEEDSRWDAGGNRESLGLAACREIEEEAGPVILQQDLYLIAQEEKSNGHILSFFFGILPYLHPIKDAGNEGEIPRLMKPEDILLGIGRGTFMESHGRIVKPIIERALLLLKNFNESTDPTVIAPEDLVLTAHEEQVPGKFEGKPSILRWRAQRISLKPLVGVHD